MSIKLPFLSSKDGNEADLQISQSRYLAVPVVMDKMVVI